MTPTLGEDFADGQQKQKQHAETLENVEPKWIPSMTPAILDGKSLVLIAFVDQCLERGDHPARVREVDNRSARPQGGLLRS
jgi:hypothetical protein